MVSEYVVPLNRRRLNSTVRVLNRRVRGFVTSRTAVCVVSLITCLAFSRPIPHLQASFSGVIFGCRNVVLTFETFLRLHDLTRDARLARRLGVQVPPNSLLGLRLIIRGHQLGPPEQSILPALLNLIRWIVITVRCFPVGILARTYAKK